MNVAETLHQSWAVNLPESLRIVPGTSCSVRVTCCDEEPRIWCTLCIGISAQDDLKSYKWEQHVFFHLKVYFEGERVQVGEGQAERLPRRPRAVSAESDTGSVSGDHDLSQNRESDAQPTEPPRCPL